MAIFTKKNKMPNDALNISLSLYGDAEKTLFLETKDGYITKEKYTPENMGKVTALLIGGTACVACNAWEERIPINSGTITFSAHLCKQENTPPFLVKSIAKSRFKQAFSVYISDGRKSYNFEAVGDLYNEFNKEEESAIYTEDFIYGTDSCVLSLENNIITIKKENINNESVCLDPNDPVVISAHDQGMSIEEFLRKKGLTVEQYQKLRNAKNNSSK